MKKLPLIPLIVSENLEYNQLSLIEQVIFSAIYDRAKLNEKKGQFNDKKVRKYFAVYTTEKLAKIAKTSINTAVLGIKHMCELGLLKVRMTRCGNLEFYPIDPTIN